MALPWTDPALFPPMCRDGDTTDYADWREVERIYHQLFADARIEGRTLTPEEAFNQAYEQARKVHQPEGVESP